MDEIFKDSRFTKLVNDPKYRQIPKAERKVKIDKRFQSMFDNEKFKVKYTIDKRGRPVNQSSSENLKKYYDLTSEEEENSEDDSSAGETDSARVSGQFVRRPPSESEEDSQESDKEVVNDEDIVKDELKRGKLPKEIKKKLRDSEFDYARGEGVLLSDSSSEEELSEEEDEETEHGWGELDADAECTEDATNRLAVCNMDWDNIKASDLFVLFNSFVPAGGLLKSVTIYPSEFGIKRMEEEELRGPIELTETKKTENKEANNSEDDENEEGSKYHMEKLRQYQLNRLKYYYAVVVCDSATTADKIYTECDGVEYESSSAKLDLRFVPDDVTFDQEVHEECIQAPDADHYKPRLFTTTALQQAKVQLTWDAANPHRTETLRGAAGGDIKDEDLKNYLAYSSTESESENEETKEKVSGDENDDEIVDPIAKYKALLQDIESTETKKKNKEVEMEITWGRGLKEKTEELVRKKMTHGGEKQTPFEELVEKRKEKKKAKKLERKKQANLKKTSGSDEDGYTSEDIPSDVDMNDPYFAEEFNNSEFKKKSKKKSKKHVDSDENSKDEENQRQAAELELLLDDDHEGKAHFSLKKIQNAENETKSKRKRNLKDKMKRNAEAKAALPNFEVDVTDARFSALFTSHHYNIDPTDPNFKKTKAMDTLIQEKLKRRPAEGDLNDNEGQKNSKKPKHDAAMSVLIKSIKRKSKKQND